MLDIQKRKNQQEFETYPICVSRTHPFLLRRRGIRHWHRPNTIQMPAQRTKIAGNDPLAINGGLSAVMAKDSIPCLILKFMRVILFYEAALAIRQGKPNAVNPQSQKKKASNGRCDTYLNRCVLLSRTSTYSPSVPVSTPTK